MLSSSPRPTMRAWLSTARRAGEDELAPEAEALAYVHAMINRHGERAVAAWVIIPAPRRICWSPSRYTAAMTAKETLHQIVDALSDEEAEELLDFLNLRADPDTLTP